MSKSKQPIKVLVWGDYKCTTGFATVLHNLLSRFKRHYAERWYMDVIAINWPGVKVENDAMIEGVPAEYVVTIDTEDGKKEKYIHTIVEDEVFDKEGNKHPKTMITSAVMADGKHDPFGRHIFLTKLKYFDYDVVFIINDLAVVTPHIDFMLECNAEKRQQNKKQFKLVYYFPIDSVPLKGALNGLEKVHLPVVYTEYGYKEVLKIKPSMEGKLKTILHGINSNDFFPMEQKHKQEKKEFREIFFEQNKDKVIFCNVNRNQPRKDIPSTILAFEKLKYEYGADNAFLYLHMNPEDVMGWNLYVLISQTKLKYGVDIIFTPPVLVEKAPTPGFLNCIYNACDCYITSTTGEGFGLTIVEAMAAGTLVIAPNHTSISELLFNQFKENGIALEEVYPYVSKYDSIIREQVSIDELADKMLMVYEAKLHERKTGNFKFEKLINNALSFADKINWDKIAKRWIDELDKLI